MRTNPRLRATFRADVTASLVVFLVALPLCVGVAVASGVPAELGLVTGIVGGLVTAPAGQQPPGQRPAAGLTVLVAEAVHGTGWGVLGVIVLVAGLLQLAMGALRLGRWFRAISVAVVHGMLAGIGLVLIAGQVYALAGREGARPSGSEKLIGLPGPSRTAGRAPGAGRARLGVGTVALMVLWKRLPGRRGRCPAPLAAVALAAGGDRRVRLPVDTVEVQGLLAPSSRPDASDSAGWRPSAARHRRSRSPSSPRRRACSARRRSTGCTTAPAPTTTRS